MATTFNTTNLIKQVKLPGSETVYELADAASRSAIETIETNIGTINSQISSLTAGGLSYSIVETLPEGDAIQQNVIYLVASEEAVGSYVEYLAVKDDEEIKLEQIGTTETDLEDYEKVITSITVPSYEASGTASVGKTSIVPAKANGQAATVITEGSNGSAASWGATVSNGVLEFSWTANTPSTVATFGSVDVATVDSAVENVATVDAAATVVTGIHSNGTSNATINH